MKLIENFVAGTAYSLSFQLVNVPYQLILDRSLYGKFIYLAEDFPFK